MASLTFAETLKQYSFYVELTGCPLESPVCNLSSCWATLLPAHVFSGLGLSLTCLVPHGPPAPYHIAEPWQLGWVRSLPRGCTRGACTGWACGQQRLGRWGEAGRVPKTMAGRLA